MASISASKALADWLDRGLIDTETHARLAGDLRQLDQRPSRSFAIIAAFGGALVGVGIIMFVASHWQSMSPFSRIVTMVTGHLLLCALALTATRRGHHSVASALWVSATLAMGAGIFAIAQIYNFTLTYWQGPLLWAIGALVMAWATRSSLQVMLAVPLAILAFGWFGGGRSWFMDDQFEFLFGRGGIRSLLPHLGVGLACLGLLVRSSSTWRFASRMLIGWGMTLVVLPMTIASAHPYVARWLFEATDHWKYVATVAAATGLVMVYAWLHRGRSGADDRLLLATWLMPIALAALASGMDPDNRWLLALFALMVFGYAMLGVWAGTELGSRAIVNVGVILGASTVIVQYFSWTFSLLDRSAAFVGGGIVLLGVAGFAENRRRALLRRIDR